MNEQEFIAEVAEQVPSLLESLGADEGLFYIQVGTFRHHVQAQIDGGAVKDLKLCFTLIERALRAGNSEVSNAIGVACLEYLNFRDGKRNRSWAIQHLQPQSVGALKALGCYPSGGAA
jgi:hypothetical protein